MASGQQRVSSATMEAVKDMQIGESPQEGYAQVTFTLTVAFSPRPGSWLAKRLPVPGAVSILDQGYWGKVVKEGVTLPYAEACALFVDWGLRMGAYGQAAPAPGAADQSTTPG